MKLKALIFISLFALALEAASMAAEPPPKPKTRQTENLTQNTYGELMRAQKLISENKTKAAHIVLNDLLKSDKLNNYERANVMQQIAFAYVSDEDFTSAIIFLKKALVLKTLPEQSELQTLFNLGQIYIAAEKYRDGIKALTDWMKRVENVSGQAFALLAQAHALLGEIKPAINYAQRAVASSERPRENWLHLLISLYLQQENYAKALPLVKQGAALYPQARIFWQQLAGIYAELDQHRNSFAALRTMHRLGLFKTSSEYERLAQLYLGFDAPVQAAKILEEGFGKKIVKQEPKNYELLGDAWLMAHEWQRALAPLDQAAKLSDDGKIFLRLGHTYIEDEQWARAENRLTQALKKGGLKDPGQAWLLLGIAQAKQNKTDKAITTLDQALQYDKVSSQAKMWLDNIRAARQNSN